jgi:hypothetical protein
MEPQYRLQAAVTPPLACKHRLTSTVVTSLAPVHHSLEVLGSNLSPKTSIWIPQSLKTCAKVVPQIRSRPLPSTSLPIHYSLNILSYSQIKLSLCLTN